MLVTREADYALRCVLAVAELGRTSAAAVARVEGISPSFLGKIVHSLARSGILTTRRGVGGGIALARSPQDITLLQVIEAVGGPLAISECILSPDSCGHLDGCPAYPYLCDAQDRLRESLDVSLLTILDRRDGGETGGTTALRSREGAGNGRARKRPAVRASGPSKEGGA
ncbi:MAG TPA: Rrf2 family transcriptional regulator [Actinomycetota bacterium]|nr:Rrf2 family transcriptional regulator [Actinomycetota bacterium]